MWHISGVPAIRLLEDSVYWQRPSNMFLLTASEWLAAGPNKEDFLSGSSRCVGRQLPHPKPAYLGRQIHNWIFAGPTHVCHVFLAKLLISESGPFSLCEITQRPELLPELSQVMYWSSFVRFISMFLDIVLYPWHYY